MSPRVNPPGEANREGSRSEGESEQGDLSRADWTRSPCELSLASVKPP